MTLHNKSAKQNISFNNEVSRLSIEAGVALHVARNILRWRKAYRPNRKAPEYKSLSDLQWLGPAARLAAKIKDGTSNTTPPCLADFGSEPMKNEFNPEDTYQHSVVAFGMVNFNGNLYAKEDWSKLNA